MGEGENIFWHLCLICCSCCGAELLTQASRQVMIEMLALVMARLKALPLESAPLTAASQPPPPPASNGALPCLMLKSVPTLGLPDSGGSKQYSERAARSI